MRNVHFSFFFLNNNNDDNNDNNDLLMIIIIMIIIIVPTACGKAHPDTPARKGGRYCWKPSSSSNLSIRAFRAYSPIEIIQPVIYRATRGDSI